MCFPASYSPLILLLQPPLLGEGGEDGDGRARHAWVGWGLATEPVTLPPRGMKIIAHPHYREGFGARWEHGAAHPWDPGTGKRPAEAASQAPHGTGTPQHTPSPAPRGGVGGVPWQHCLSCQLGPWGTSLGTPLLAPLPPLHPPHPRTGWAPLWERLAEPPLLGGGGCRVVVPPYLLETYCPLM